VEDNARLVASGRADHAATAHHVAVEVERIRNCRSPDRLLLDGQLILEGAEVRLEPRRRNQENP